MGEFVKGVREGTWTTFTAEGKSKLEEGSYTGGKRDGEWSYWDAGGRLATVVKYGEGEIVSTQEMEPPKPAPKND